MSGGGGKGGSETTETTIPDWIKQPAIRNLQRAEDVQRIEYMPYYGGDVAAFTPTQNAAFQSNINAAEAFGLLAPNTLTPTSGMPTPTDFDGFTGYSSQPMYESALAELKANQPGAVAQYDALFGANVPTQRNWSPPSSRFRGSAGGGVTPSSPPRNIPMNMTQAEKDMMAGHMDRINDERGHYITKVDGKFVQTPGAGVTEAQDNWKKIQAMEGFTPALYGSGGKQAIVNANINASALANQAAYEAAAAPPWLNQNANKVPTNVGNPFGYGMKKKK